MNAYTETIQAHQENLQKIKRLTSELSDCMTSPNFIQYPQSYTAEEDPKVDFVFKNIFGSDKNPQILISFLNAILNPIKRITKVEDVPFLRFYKPNNFVMTVCERAVSLNAKNTHPNATK